MTRDQVARMSDEELERHYDELQEILDAGDPDDAEFERIHNRMRWIEAEQDARDAWNSDDDRVRESVGNYRSHLGGE